LRSVEPFNIGVLLFEDVELMDFAGPFEVFSVASRIQDTHVLNVFSIGLHPNNIKTWNRVLIQPDYTILNHPEIHFLVVPGGSGTKALVENSTFITWLESRLNQAECVMGVCSSTRIFAQLGLLNDNPFCTHHSVYDEITTKYPSSIPHKNKRFVKTTNKLYTSAGVSAGIDLAFYLLGKITDSEIVDLTAKYMEYPIRHSIP